MKRILWLPIEVQKRELLGAEILIQDALNRGFTVVVGEQNSSVFRYCRGGVVLHKDWSPWSYELIRSWKANNVKVALFDIEGLLFKSESDYIHRRVCTEALNDADLLFFCCFSELSEQISTIRSLSNFLIPIRINQSGNKFFSARFRANDIAIF